MKKPELFFLLLLVVAGLAILAGTVLRHRQPGNRVVVSVDGKQIGSYALSRDRRVSLTGAAGEHNELVIRDHKASIVDADCPDKLCVKQPPISREGESIVCLPHKLVVRIVREGTKVLETEAD